MQKIKNMLHHNKEDNSNKHHGGLFHRHHETETVAPLATAAPTQAVPATELLAKQDMHDELLLRKDEVVAPVQLQKSVDLLGSGELTTKIELAEANTTVLREPALLERVDKEVVVHEHVHPVEKEEIQPIIHREREQLEVHQVTERLHETEIAPTMVEQRELAPEVREVIIEKAAPIAENIQISTVEVDATLKSQVVHAPLVNEVIKKTVIEEVQPVLEKDVIVPTVVQETQHVYEKIVEAPVVYREELPVRELSQKNVAVTLEEEQMKGKVMSTSAPLSL